MLMAVTSASLTAVLVHGSDDRAAVLVAAHAVPVGQQLTAGDVRVVKVGTASLAGFVPAGRRSVVVGRVAAVPLTAGAMLHPDQLAEVGQWPPPEMAQVAFAVERGDVPPGLRAGQRVAVYEGEHSPVARAGDGERPGDALVGTVSSVKEAASPGDRTVVAALVERGAARRAAVLAQPRIVALGTAAPSRGVR
jgi:Flp pilus assembly protein CpaB